MQFVIRKYESWISRQPEFQNMSPSELNVFLHSMWAHMALIGMAVTATLTIWTTTLCIRHLLAPALGSCFAFTSKIGKRVLEIMGYVILCGICLCLLGFGVYVWLQDYAVSLMGLDFRQIPWGFYYGK